MHGFCGVLLLFFLKMRYLIPGVIMILVDLLYLSTFGKNIFVPMISSIQKEKVQFRWYAAILCYILLVFGLDYFIISQKRPLIDAFVLGVCIYGVYETTNMAIFKDWDYKIGFIDMAWGGILYLITTYLYLNIIKIII